MSAKLIKVEGTTVKIELTIELSKSMWNKDCGLKSRENPTGRYAH
jgi:hypothetical protein